MSRRSKKQEKEHAEFIADAYLFWADGHSIAETANYFGVTREQMSIYIRDEIKRDREAAAQGKVIKRVPSKVTLESPIRWMTDEEIRRSWRFAADKLMQTAILAQLNGLSPRAIEKIVGGTA